MNELNQLRHQVYSTTNAPRELLVAYVKALVKQAKQLPPNEREARGDLSRPGYEPQQTRGEDIVWDILSCLLQQDWISYDTADDLEEIIEVASQLDINADDHELWQALFEKVDNLSLESRSR